MYHMGLSPSTSWVSRRTWTTDLGSRNLRNLWPWLQTFGPGWTAATRKHSEETSWTTQSSDLEHDLPSKKCFRIPSISVWFRNTKIPLFEGRPTTISAKLQSDCPGLHSDLYNTTSIGAVCSRFLGAPHSNFANMIKTPKTPKISKNTKKTTWCLNAISWTAPNNRHFLWPLSLPPRCFSSPRLDQGLGPEFLQKKCSKTGCFKEKKVPKHSKKNSNTNINLNITKQPVPVGFSSKTTSPKIESSNITAILV